MRYWIDTLGGLLTWSAIKISIAAASEASVRVSAAMPSVDYCRVLDRRLSILSLSTSMFRTSFSLTVGSHHDAYSVTTPMFVTWETTQQRNQFQCWELV